MKNTNNRSKQFLSEEEKKQAFKRAEKKAIEMGYGDNYGSQRPSDLKKRLITNINKERHMTYYKGDLESLYYNMDRMTDDEFLDIIYNAKKDAESQEQEEEREDTE